MSSGDPRGCPCDRDGVREGVAGVARGSLVGETGASPVGNWGHWCVVLGSRTGVA